MIEKIELENVATYQTKQSLLNLQAVNYIYGSNGSGKTTISRVLKSPEIYDNCCITWKNNQQMDILVYNSDFVKEHFSEDEVLKGVFTLGAENADVLKQIKEKKLIEDDIQKQLSQLNKTLNGDMDTEGKIQELEKERKAFEDDVWNYMSPYKEALKKCFEGFLGGKKAFADKVLKEYSSNNAELLLENELLSKYKEIFAKDIQKENPLEQIDASKLHSLEGDIILQKNVIGKEDVDIARLIQKLNNSAWVYEGIQYYKETDGVCPFCQQHIYNDFEHKLNEYFNDTYNEDIKKIDFLYANYTQEGENLLQKLQLILNSNNQYIDQNSLETHVRILETSIQNNLKIIESKRKEASKKFELKSSTDLVKEITQIINLANIKINEHNVLIDNLKDEQEALKTKVWKFIIEKAKNSIEIYQEKEKRTQKAILSIQTQYKEKEVLLKTTQIELQGLEKKITSVQPTCDKINQILKSYGFQGFSLKVINENSYILVRSDGTKVNNNLSEGEKNFLTFLYFYCYVKGSFSGQESSISDRVVVFDDPISSLDNEVLFIVSSLIRDIIIDKDNKFDNVKQVIILTHNIYFHKEVSYVKKKKNNDRLKTKAFWIVTKKNNQSFITKYDTNPIKTSYQSLWENIKDEKINPVSLPNDMRRILESYFTTLGGVPIDDLEGQFEGDEKIICRALCSWLNDNSHTCFGDEFYSPLDENQIRKYKEVFKKIFEKYNHLAHYNMMMGISEEVGE